MLSHTYICKIDYYLTSNISAPEKASIWRVYYRRTARLAWAHRKSTHITGMRWKTSQKTHHVEPWGRWTTTAEDQVPLLRAKNRKFLRPQLTQAWRNISGKYKYNSYMCVYTVYILKVRGVRNSPRMHESIDEMIYRSGWMMH